MKSGSGVVGTIVTGLIIATMALLIEYKSGWFQGNVTANTAASALISNQSQSQQENLRTREEIPSKEREDDENQGVSRSSAPTGTSGTSVVTPLRVSPTVSSITTIDLTGRWSGEWSTPKGYLFTFSMDLQLSDQTVVTGKINWTFKLSPRVEEQRLIGRSATEFIRGSFDPRNRALMFQGYDKEDHYGVIALDSYRLIVSDDAQEIRGKTQSNGTWEGEFIARRSGLP